MTAPFRLRQQTYREHYSHRTGGILTIWTPELVAGAKDQPWAFAEYVQQTLGVPWATQNDLNILRRKIKELFDRYPRATYYTLCRVVQWCKEKRRHFSNVWCVLDCFRFAFADGIFPELVTPRVDDEVEQLIQRALAVETDESWRARLICTEGASYRRAAYEEWKQVRGT